MNLNERVEPQPSVDGPRDNYLSRPSRQESGGSISNINGNSSGGGGGGEGGGGGSSSSAAMGVPLIVDSMALPSEVFDNREVLKNVMERAQHAPPILSSLAHTSRLLGQAAAAAPMEAPKPIASPYGGFDPTAAAFHQMDVVPMLPNMREDFLLNPALCGVPNYGYLNDLNALHGAGDTPSWFQVLQYQRAGLAPVNALEAPTFFMSLQNKAIKRTNAQTVMRRGPVAMGNPIIGNLGPAGNPSDVDIDLISASGLLNKLHSNQPCHGPSEVVPDPLVAELLKSCSLDPEKLVALVQKLRFSFSAHLNSNIQWIYVICSSYEFIEKYIAARAKEQITMKSILKAISTSIGLKVFKINRKKEELLSLEAAIVMIYMKSKHCSDTSVDMAQFVAKYPHFEAAKLDAKEMSKLLEFCNCVRIVQCLIPPHNNKEHILDLASRLTEGASVKRVTGTGMTQETRHRYEIVHLEGGVAPRMKGRTHVEEADRSKFDDIVGIKRDHENDVSESEPESDASDEEPGPRKRYRDAGSLQNDAPSPEL